MAPFLSRSPRRLLLLGPAVLAALTTAAGPAGGGLRRGVGDFVFTGSPGARQRPVRVWHYRPADWRPEDPIVFVMHGAERNARRYREAWIPEADRGRFLLIVPEFPARDYPSRAYQQGNVLAGDGAPLDSTEWSFTTVEAIFDEVRARSGSRRESYRLYGHSAGAQFVHRMLLFMPQARVERATVANAGWYTLPTFDEAYPYGLSGVLDRAAWDERLRAAFARPVPLLLATADTVAGPDLRTTAAAMRQGPDRLTRGQTFYRTARETAAARGLPFHWTVEAVPDAGHSNRQMAATAARVLND